MITLVSMYNQINFFFFFLFFFSALKPLTKVQKDSLTPLMIRNMSARRPGSRGRDISLDGRLLARGDKHSVAVWDVDKWSKKELFPFF